ncbi:hypothetical protein RRG08_036346 [Elysia crispata]|uniref:Uncharacterized protein n=1 Tax=Elysia crispata TaxID=231223 RepID=A0AAE1DHC6_9GAST|nr:hypothetical protein RRG08_036346 [Elysia crispata]
MPPVMRQGSHHISFDMSGNSIREKTPGVGTPGYVCGGGEVGVFQTAASGGGLGLRQDVATPVVVATGLYRMRVRQAEGGTGHRSGKDRE